MKQFIILFWLFSGICLNQVQAKTPLIPSAKTSDAPSLSITVSPVSTTYSVGQSVTVNVTGGTDNTTYTLLIYDGDPYDSGTSSTDPDSYNSSGVNSNTTVLATGQTSTSFVVYFRQTTTTANAVFVLTNDDVSEVAISSPFQVICPTVSISALPSLTIGQGTSVTLTASAGESTGQTSFTWSNGQTGTSIDFIPTSTTTLSVTGVGVSGGCSGTATVTVTVSSLTLTTSASPTSVCVGSLASLSVAASGGTGPYSYTWAAPTGAAISGATNTSVVSVSGSTSGLKTFTVTVADANATPIVSVTTVSITVNPSVTASIAGNLTICTGGSTTLTASGGTTYLWDNGVNTAVNPVSPTSTTAYSVTVSSNGCSSVTTVTVTVNSAVTASIAASPSLTICPGSVATLTASGAGTGGSYLWSNAQTTPAISVSTSGPYTVTATSVGGCSSTATVTVSVTSPAPLSAPTLSASSSVVCEGGTVSVSATANGTITYQWYKDGLSLGSSQQGSTLSLGGVQSTQAGSYILVIQADGCSSASSTAFALTVNPLPTVTLVFPDVATVVGTGVPTITVPVGTGLNYQVLGGMTYERLIDIDRVNGYFIRQSDQSSTGVFPINRAGLYTITVTDANGCQRTVQGVIVGQ